MKFLSILALLSLASISQARIGETINECRKRYGKEHDVQDGGWGVKSAHFRVKDVLVVAQIKDKRCVSITYVFPDEVLKFRDREMKPHRLSPTVVRHLLDANGKEWVRVDWQAHHDSMKFISKDGDYASFQGRLVSFSNAWYAAKNDKIDYGKSLVQDF